MADHPLLKRLFGHKSSVNPYSIIADHQMDLPPLVTCAQFDGAVSWLAEPFPLIRQFDGVVHRVANQMGQGVRESLDDAFVQFDVLPVCDESHLLVVTSRQGADDPLEFPEDDGDRLHPHPHDLLLHLGCDPADVLQHGVQSRGVSHEGEGGLHELVSSKDQLTCEVHQVVEKADADPDFLLGLDCPLSVVRCLLSRI